MYLHIKKLVANTSYEINDLCTSEEWNAMRRQYMYYN